MPLSIFEFHEHRRKKKAYMSSALFIRCRQNRYMRCPRYLLSNHKCLKLMQRSVHDAFEHLFLSQEKAKKSHSLLIGVHEITFTLLPQSYMTSAGKERLFNHCVLRHRLHRLHSSYKLQKMLVSFTHAEGTTIGPTSCIEGWGFLDAKVTRLSLFDPSGTRAPVGRVYTKCCLQNLEPFCLLTTELPFRPSDYRGCLSGLFSRSSNFSFFLSSLPSFFFIRAPFYLLIIRVKGYCCTLSLSMTHTHFAGVL
jgi:hypothetical protein